MAKEKICGIYKIENLVNGKVYIGSSCDIKKRWRDHKYQLRHNKHYNNYLQNSWNKYREDNFKFKIVEETKDLQIREQYWIDSLNSFNNKFGYNLSKYVDHHKLSQETKDKIGLSSSKRFGEFASQSKLKEKQVIIIISKLLNNETCSKISKDLKISRRSINDIKLKNTWKHLTNNIEFPNTNEYFKGENNNNSILTEEQVIEIKTRLKNGDKGVFLSKLFNVSQILISNIKLNKTWTHITI